MNKLTWLEVPNSTVTYKWSIYLYAKNGRKIFKVLHQIKVVDLYDIVWVLYNCVKKKKKKEKEWQNRESNVGSTEK